MYDNSQCCTGSDAVKMSVAPCMCTCEGTAVHRLTAVFYSREKSEKFTGSVNNPSLLLTQNIWIIFTAENNMSCLINEGTQFRINETTMSFSLILMHLYSIQQGCVRLEMLQYLDNSYFRLITLHDQPHSLTHTWLA